MALMDSRKQQSYLPPASRAAQVLNTVPEQVKREKAVYHTLNKLSVDVTRKVLVAEAWCPVSGKERVHSTLRSASQNSAASVRPFIHHPS